MSVPPLSSLHWSVEPLVVAAQVGVVSLPGVVGVDVMEGAGGTWSNVKASSVTKWVASFWRVTFQRPSFDPGLKAVHGAVSYFVSSFQVAPPPDGSGWN